MIIEGIVTTTGPDGSMHVAAMGPTVDEAERRAAAITRLVLRPFATSQTATNLVARPQGVFHLSDDVLLLARIVVGAAGDLPARPATHVQGWVLDDACRAYEFIAPPGGRPGERLCFEAQVVAEHAGRPFLGFSRAAHAVVEGAILVTRLHLLGAAEVADRLADLSVLVEKTGGDREREAFELLRSRAAAAPAAGRL